MERRDLPPIWMTYRVVTSKPGESLERSTAVVTQAVPVGERGRFGLNMEFEVVQVLAHYVEFDVPDYLGLIERAREEGRGEIVTALRELAGERTIADYLDDLDREDEDD